MPKPIPEEELERILRAVGSLPDGASVDDIAARIATPWQRRTLQRRLVRLVEQRRLVASGRGRGRRYGLLPSSPPVIPGETGETEEVALSPESEAIRRAVLAPLGQRRPVGYNRAFLDAYHPNETWYLDEGLRQRLHALGAAHEAPMPAGTYARKVLHRLLIDLSWNSSRLEGNTYSLLETARLLEWGESSQGKAAAEAQMILNHKEAIELLVDAADEIGFNPYTILNLHALLADNLLPDAMACGRLRVIPVGIDQSVYLPLIIPQQIEECFQQLLNTAAAIRDPFEQAFFAMVHLPYLQPFEDVNKRVSRLAANIPLIRHNLAPLSFVDVPREIYIQGMLGVYELNQVALLRELFVWAYQRSCARYGAVRQSLGQPDPLRMRYRALLGETVAGVVRGGMDKGGAIAFIREQTREQVPAEDAARFIEIAETELLGLHEGNIARFRIRPGEYHHWRQTWE